MNDLYKDLYYQAVEWCVSQGSDEAWAWEKKYAELIVKECMRVSCNSNASYFIAEHFGLDE